MDQTQEQKREELRQKIEASEARNAERGLGDYAADIRDGTVNFAKDHPIAAVAGGLALGVVIASLIPGPGRRMRRRATSKASSLASTLSELGIAYASGLFETAGDLAEDLGDGISDKARHLNREAHYRAGETGDAARALSRRAGKKASRTLRDLRR
ncbi:hypothetical protein G7A66_01910 [Altererythrobacter sp. SALINAS58]|uniref:hypothetical protein n=1 Tax=Alteripontixanthobacter muriae TaxID=2705546 RepID=UPI00157554DD|nr:hypothetical protein [Alteripontixanthobacter muriae]NTZ41863.1 hypothetical protein [Alteripontixanthobacter muriae]